MKTLFAFTLWGAPLLAACSGGLSHSAVPYPDAGHGAPGEGRPLDNTGTGGSVDLATQGSIDLATSEPNNGDAGLGDAGKPPAPNLGCPVGALSCEGFESGSLDSKFWSIGGGIPRVLVDTQRAHSGNASLRITAGPGISETKLLPNTQPLFLRFWAYNPTLATSGFSINASSTSSSIRLFTRTSDGSLNMWRVPPGNAQWILRSKGIHPVGRWYCVEWQIDAGSTASHTWLDGAPLADLTASGVPPDSTITSIFFQAFGADDIWIDDIAFGTTRLGCGN